MATRERSFSMNSSGCSACALDISGDQITGIRAIVNPDKLTHLGPVGDLGSLLNSAR